MTVNLATAVYKSTGSTTSRSLGARAADVVNVLDYGATGNGSTDDTAAIQAAVNWTVATGNRGIIFFPLGTYKVTAPITFPAYTAPNGILFRGVGMGSLIQGNFAGFIFDRPSAGGVSGVMSTDGFEDLWISHRQYNDYDNVVSRQHKFYDVVAEPRWGCGWDDRV